jgi:hypothetical protein
MPVPRVTMRRWTVRMEDRLDRLIRAPGGPVPDRG